MDAGTTEDRSRCIATLALYQTTVDDLLRMVPDDAAVLSFGAHLEGSAVQIRETIEVSDVSVNARRIRDPPRHHRLRFKQPDYAKHRAHQSLRNTR